MKKGIGMILLITMLFGSLPVSAKFSDLETSSYPEAIEELEALEVINGFTDGTVRPKDNVTRAEFAVIIMNVLNINAENAEGASVFSDVTNHWAKDEITFLTSMGYLSGYGDGTFRPDHSITGYEALKILVHILGYSYQANIDGGYPLGYQTTASSIEMLKGLKIDYSRFITREEICKLVDNALTIPVMEAIVTTGDQTKYEANRDVTLLSKYLKAGKDKGVVEANDLVSLSGKVATENCIRINGAEYRSDSLELDDLVGLSVDYLYKADEDSEIKELLLVRVNDRSKQLVIDRQDYLSFEGNKITYEDADEKIRTVSISSTADIFYNGDYFTFDRDVFKDAAMGNIRLISSDSSSAYNVVFITAYNNMTVGKVDKTNAVLTDEEDFTKKLNLNTDDRKVILTGASGPISVSDIKRFDIVTYAESNDRVEATVTRKVVQGTVESVQQDKEKFFVIKGEEYPLSPQLKYDTSAEYTGKSVKAYLDSYGKIAYLTVGQTAGSTIVYLVALSDLGDKLDPKPSMKYYDTSDGLQVAEFADRVTVNDKTSKDVSAEQIARDFLKNGSVSQAVMITKDGEGKINSIKQAKSVQELEESGSDGFCEAFGFEKRKWSKDNCSFVHKIRITRDENTPIALVPLDATAASEKEFKTVSRSYLAHDEEYDVAAYHSSVDFSVCDFIVIRTDEVSGADILDIDTPLSVVDRTATIVTEEGDVVTRLYVRTGDTEDYIDLTDTDVTYTYKKDNAAVKTYKPDELEKGDIIRYQTNSYHELKVFEVCYDESGAPELGTEKWIGPVASDTLLRANDVVRSTVAKRVDNSALCLNTGFESGPYDYINILLTETMLKGRITVIERTSDGRIRVKAGSATDVEVGDRITALFRYSMIWSIVVDKDR